MKQDDKLAAKLEQAKAYLRERGKLLLVPGCTFRPTRAEDRFSILERYGKPQGKGGGK